MSAERAKDGPDKWCGVRVAPGESRDLDLVVGESYSGITVRIPVHVRRGRKKGPAVFITAAIHGDEINGTGAVRDLVQDPSLQLRRGVVVFVPVLNILGFERHSRYLPDRRDLNRSFPGSSRGSLAGRMASVIFREIVRRCDYGIDLHTAAVRRTNFPTIRADLRDREVGRIARAFGCEIVLDAPGPTGALRRAACNSGCATLVFEGGEVWKVEPTVVDCAVRGVRNVLAELRMLETAPEKPDAQVVIQKTKWLRAERGGFLQFHAGPGAIVRKGEAVATNTSLLGQEQNVVMAPFDGILIGMTTLPAVSPGEPICHIGKVDDTSELDRILKYRARENLSGRLASDLATGVQVVDR